MANYDSTVMQAFADKLYSQANSIVISYTFIGAVIGAGGVYFVNAHPNTPTLAIAAIGIGLIGLALGLQRSFALKVQAQTVLLQMKIEENTRK